MGVSHVIWDWNGTLFDDLHCCVGVANQLLSEFGLPTLDGVPGYHAKFRFPIVEYYADLGFDTAPGGNFEAAARRFVELYRDAAASCGLRSEATDTLASLHGSGIRQVVISASHQATLDRQLAPFGLDRWLDAAHGLDNIYAHSKEGLVRRWIAEAGVHPADVLMVGDSEHDFEIADAVGARCVLVSGGHHSEERLGALGPPVVDRLTSVLQVASTPPRRAKTGRSRASVLIRRA